MGKDGTLPDESDVESQKLSEVGLESVLDVWETDKAAPKKTDLHQIWPTSDSTEEQDAIESMLNDELVRDSSESYPYSLIASDSNQKRKYVLTSNMRNAITSGDIEDNSSEIYDRLELLPLRIQDLITDLSILSNSGSISSEHWRQAVEQSHGSRGYSYQQQKVGGYVHRDDYWDAGKLGYKLGLAFRIFQEAAEARTDWDDLLWGFAAAHIADTDADSEKENLEHLIEYFRSRFEERRHDAKLRSSIAEFTLEDLEDVRELVTFVEPKLTGEAATALTNRVGSVSEKSRSEVNQLLSGIIQSTPIIDVCALQRKVKHDLETLSDGENDSSVAVACLEIIFTSGLGEPRSADADDIVSVEEIRDQLPDKYDLPIQKNQLNSVDSFIRQGVGILTQDDDYKEIRHPIIKQRADSRKYYLTDYGALVARCILVEEGTRWMYERWENPEGIDSNTVRDWNQYIRPALVEVENGEYETMDDEEYSDSVDSIYRDAFPSVKKYD